MFKMGFTFVLLVIFAAQQASCRVRAYTGGIPGTGVQRHLAQDDVYERTADISQPRSDRVIVLLRDDLADMITTADALVSEVQAAMAAMPALPGVAAASATAPGSSSSQISILHTFGADSSSTSSESHDAATAAPTSSSGSSALRSVVLKAPAAAIPHIKTSKYVKGVIHDLTIVHQAARAVACVQHQDLRAGSTAVPSATFKWPGCILPTSKLIWKGRVCNTSRITYTEVTAVHQTTNAVLRDSSGKPCSLRADPARGTWSRQRFGECGTAPLFARSLPTRLCSATGGAATSPRPGSSPPPGGGNPGTLKPPGQNPTHATMLPRRPVTPGEQIPAGISRIEAATAADGVFNTAGLPVSQQVAVAVVDSGIDGTHPDLNLIGGKSWVAASANVAGDQSEFDFDRFGHGTHVAGIIGAKDSGNGVVGVAPGIPLYSLKVLDGEGAGSISDAMAAVEWAAGPEGQSQGIKVINLSLAAYVDPTSADYAETFKLVCNSFKRASDAGIVVVAAVGNYQRDLTGHLPASCPTVVAVTAMDPVKNEVSSFTNYLPTNAPESVKARVIAAPGSGILSTISYARQASGYRELSGTSQASPHVAGVAATCLMAGVCRVDMPGISHIATLQATAADRLRLAPRAAYGFKGDAAAGDVGGKYVGNLVWAGY